MKNKKSHYIYLYKEVILLLYTPIIDLYSEDELRNIVNDSYSMAEVVRKLHYKTVNGRNVNTVRKRLDEYNISTDHFKYVKGIERTFDNVFCENSTATQNTLRRWFKKISNDSVCEICGHNKIWNGKELTMTLDHINGNNHDNRIENLRWICPNCGSQLDTFAGRNRTTDNINRLKKDILSNKKKRKVSKKICPVCNKNEIYSNSKMCLECRKKERRKNIPPKEELEKLIIKIPFTKIGKMYNVSDNAVRKWCKSYNLL